MFRSKRAQVFNIILIVTVSIALLLAYAFVVLEAREIYLDERKVNTQLVLFTFYHKNCFSDNFGTFREDLLTQENINSCFEGLDEDISVRFSIDSEVFYVHDRENQFNRLRDFCSIRSSLMCTQMSYPVVYIGSSQQQRIEELKIQIIV